MLCLLFFYPDSMLKNFAPLTVLNQHMFWKTVIFRQISIWVEIDALNSCDFSNIYLPIDDEILWYEFDKFETCRIRL